MGHPYGPNDERGVFRTTDGGRTWQKVLFIDRNTGAAQVEIDPTNPAVSTRRCGAIAKGRGKTAALPARRVASTSRSTAAPRGTSWPVACPTARKGSGGSAFAIAPSDPRRIYALVAGPSGTRHLPLGRWWLDVAACEQRCAARRRYPRAPEERGCCLRRQTPLRINRKTAAAPGPHSRERRVATTISGSGSIPRTPTSCCSRPIREPRHDQRRPDLVVLVQPANGAALSRHDRPPVSLLDLRRTARKRRDGDRQSR